LIYSMPTRGLLGFRYKFLNATRGRGILNSFYVGDQPLEGTIDSKNTSSIVAREEGVSSTYGLKNAEPRGILFIGAGVEVYEGMIVGLNSRQDDIEMNICKGKKLNNIHSANADIAVHLDPPVIMTLEQCLDFIEDDELLEITPENLRLRKKYLTKTARDRVNRGLSPTV